MLKKAFWDTWDNMGRVLLLNLIMVILTVIPVFLPHRLSAVPALSVLSVILGVLLIFLFAGGASRFVKEMVYYNSPELKDLLSYIRLNARPSLILGSAFLVFTFICYTGFIFYGQLSNLFGLAGLVFLFWICLIGISGALFFFPVLNTLDRELPKIIKKCFLIFFDNTGTSVVLLGESFSILCCLLFWL